MYLPNEFIPTKNNLLTTLPVLSKEFRLNCEFVIESNPSGVALIHLTNLDRDTAAKGGRLPLVFLNAISSWQTHSWVNGRNYAKNHGALSLTKWYQVEVSQTLRDGKVRKFRMSHIAYRFYFFQYFFQVRLDGTLLHDEENTTPTDFYNVKVYAGNPWHDALDGKIRNVRISNIN